MTTLERVRRFFSVHLTTEGPTVLPAASRSDLCRFFLEAGFKEGAEIGVWTGKFSRRICELVPGLHLRCVDPWHPYAAYRERKNDHDRLQAAYLEACDRLRPFDCAIMRMTSLDAAQLVPERSLDFVYLDGNHEREYVQSDLEAWLPKIRSGGIIAGHDFQTSSERPFIQVEAVVREFTQRLGIAPWFVLAGEETPSFFWVVA